MKLKRGLAAVLVAALAVGMMTGCGSKSSDKQAASDKKETLVMATNATFPPYEYVDGQDYAGIDVEVAQAIADELGMELQIQDVEFGSIISGVQSGKFDIGMAGITVTEDRKKSVNFTNTYATALVSRANTFSSA